jgi:peroxiredoxin
MKFLSWARLVCCLLITASLGRAAVTPQDSPPQKIDISKAGPQVGERVPDFNLKDQNGKSWTLQSITGQRGSVLVFFQSADWCPYCKTQLVELQSQVDELRRKGLSLAAISYDSPEILAAFAKEHAITFPLLSDAGSVTIKKYGILNPVPELAGGAQKDAPAVKTAVQKYVSISNANASMVGIAFPGTFILDQQGRVISRNFEDFYAERNTISNILMKLGSRSSTVAGMKVSGGQVDVTTYPSDSKIAPGNHVSIALTFIPYPGIHIYAPGAKNYRVLSLNVEPQPFVRVLPMQYPASEIYLFKPLDERVPVYQKPFALIQEIVIEATPQAQAAFHDKDSITLVGTLEYQACDEAICYKPASIPLSWTFILRPLIAAKTAVSK